MSSLIFTPVLEGRCFCLFFIVVVFHFINEGNETQTSYELLNYSKFQCGRSKIHTQVCSPQGLCYLDSGYCLCLQKRPQGTSE